MISVISTSIKAVGYAGDVQELYIEFREAGMYRYFEVPRDVFDSLLDSSSKGAFVNRAIRGRFRFERVVFTSQEIARYES